MREMEKENGIVQPSNEPDNQECKAWADYNTELHNYCFVDCQGVIVFVQCIRFCMQSLLLLHGCETVIL